MDVYYIDNSVSIKIFYKHLAPLKVVQKSELKFPFMETQVIGEVEYRKDSLPMS